MQATKIPTLAAALLGLAIATTPVAMAQEAPAPMQQFVVKLDQPLTGGDEPLRVSLGICEIDAFLRGEAHYVVLHARSSAYLEAFFQARQITPQEINALPVDWSGAAFANLPIDARMAFFEPVTCEICQG